MENEILYIVMPAYNEAINIESVVAQWHPIVEKINGNSRLLIVNDGSKDDTYRKLLELQNQFPLLLPIDKPNSGHGSTCLFAYQMAIDHKATFIFQTDSDGQTDPNEFWEFWENRNLHNFIIGLRHSREDGISRIFVTRVLKILVWLMFGVWITDANTPFRLMKTENLIPILELIPKDFFLSNVAISIIGVKKKESIIWLPIKFKPRQGGVNSINMKRIFKIGIKAIKDFKIIKANLNKYL